MEIEIEIHLCSISVYDIDISIRYRVYINMYCMASDSLIHYLWSSLTYFRILMRQLSAIKEYLHL
jgi:hypothetical protein